MKNIDLFTPVNICNFIINDIDQAINNVNYL
jgi:hypothetical protein